MKSIIKYAVLTSLLVPFRIKASSQGNGFIFGPRLSSHLMFFTQSTNSFGNNMSGSMAIGNMQFGGELGYLFNVGDRFYLIPNFTIDYADFIRFKQSNGEMITAVNTYKALNPLRFGFHLGFAREFDDILFNLAIGTKIHNSKEYINRIINNIKILHTAGLSAELSLIYFIGKHFYTKCFIGFDIFFTTGEWEEWVDKYCQLALERSKLDPNIMVPSKEEVRRQKANPCAVNMGITIGTRY